MITFKTNTAEFQKLANKLEKKRRSAFPIAIRNTLNNAAFDMKGSKGKIGTIAKEFKALPFEERNKGLIKFATGVTMAKGYDVKRMRSISGIRDLKKKATKGLAAHEYGKSTKTNFVALTQARVAGSWDRRVKKQFEFDKVVKGTPRFKLGSKRQNQRFIKAAYRRGRGKFIGVGKYIGRIDNLSKGQKNIRKVVKLTMLYKDISKDVHTHRRKTFVHKAQRITAAKIPQMFRKNAQKVLNW